MNLRDVIDDTNSTASRLGCRLHDPVVHLTLLIFKIAEDLEKGNVLFWEDKCEGHNVEAGLGSGRELLSSLNVAFQEVFTGHILSPNKVISLLPYQHA